jgi:hypothetical protein
VVAIQDKIIAVDAKVTCDPFAKKNEGENISVLFTTLARLYCDESRKALQSNESGLPWFGTS